MSTLFKVAVQQADAKRERRILLGVPGSPGVDLLFRTATAGDIARCQKGGKRLHPKDEMMAGHQANLSLLATCCLEIWQDGQATLNGNGDPVGFGDRETLEDLGVATASEAVTKLVGRDGDVGTLAMSLLNESGFSADGEPLENENPT